MRTKELLSELRNQIQAQHDADWRAFNYLERRLSTPPLVTEDVPPIPPSVPLKSDEATLIGSVEQIFRSHPNVIWSVPKIAARLRTQGFILGAKNPGPSLNKAVTRLEGR